MFQKHLPKIIQIIQQIEIMDSEVTGNPRPAPEGKWVIGSGIDWYRLAVVDLY